MRKLVFFLLLSLVCLATLVWLSDGSRPDRESELPLDDYAFTTTDCWFEVSWREDIRCGTLHTPSETGAFQLPVVIIRADRQSRRPDPLLYLQGGPGASADLDREGIDSWLDWLSYAQLERDLVLMDRRGTGRSRPALKCPEYDRYSREILGEDVPLEAELAEGHALVERCFARLAAGAESFAPEHYGSAASARDIIGLIDSLDYASWNLLGVSYGTRLALAVARAPEARGRVRSLILDSVYPAERGGLQSWPRVLTEGLERFFRWCEQKPDCHGEATDLPAMFQGALDDLAQNPIPMTVPLWNGGAPVEVMVNDHRLISAVFAAVYQRHLWPNIPKAIRAALNGQREGLKPLMEPLVNHALAEDFSSLAFMAVDCRDHPPGSRDEYRQELEEYPDYARFLAPSWDYQACHFLATDAPAERPPLQPSPELPALILAGRLDPITPLEWARTLAAEWPGSQLVGFPDVGHSVIASEACAHRHLKDFLAAPGEKWTPECLGGVTGDR